MNLMHGLRIIIVSLMTLFIVRASTTVFQVMNYIILRWELDAIKYGFEFADKSTILVWLMFFFYVGTMLMIIAIWKWFALPKKVFSDNLKYLFKSIKYDGE
jgi:hypothetical protein